MVDTRSARMEGLIDDAGSKRVRVEGRSSSVCAREGVPRDTVRGVRVGEASHPGLSFLRLRRATSDLNVALAHVNSSRFSALDEDLGDTEVDEGGEAPSFTANFRESTVNESPECRGFQPM